MKYVLLFLIIFSFYSCEKTKEKVNVEIINDLKKENIGNINNIIENCVYTFIDKEKILDTYK